MLNKLAHLKGRRDEVPNQELARDLARTGDRTGIREIARNLRNSDKNIQADCIKVLYETGYIDPDLVAPYADDFLKLLASRNNRLVWGGMIALSTIATAATKKVYAGRAAIQHAIAHGSVITVDNGIKTLARVASTSDAYRRALLPYLLEHLRNCRAQDVPQHAEHVLVAVKGASGPALVRVLERRMPGMLASRQARIKRVIKAASRSGLQHREDMTGELS